MKLIGSELGRIVILAPADEWRPARGIPIADAINAIQARYHFLQAPNLSELSVSQAESEGHKFREGIVEIDNEAAVIGEFAIFKDGFSVTALDTLYAEAFLDDFLAWAREALGIRPFALDPPRLFRSQLVVQFERPLSKAFRRFNKIATILGRAFQAHTSYANSVNVVRLDLGLDQVQLPGVIKPVPLVLERRVNRPHKEEVYFSDAALPSRVHFEVLEQIEAQLA
jgi:hypothetical protein